MDGDLQAAAPPGLVEAYTADDVQALPVLALPRQIEIAAPLANLAHESDTCVLTAPDAVNLRSGPGTGYTRAGGLAANENGKPTGQAKGQDGYIWWQLAGGKWVRADVVQATGPCDALPVIVDLPPVPTAAPVPQTQTDSEEAVTTSTEQWTLVTSLVEDTCNSAGPGATFPVTIVRTPTGGSLTWFSTVYPLTSQDGVNYSGATRVGDSLYTMFLTFTSPTTLTGEQTMVHSETCHWRFSVSGTRN